MEAKSQPEGNKSGQVGAISFNLTSGYEPCVFFSKTPENDNLIASSSAHCSPDCSARLIYSATRMDITSGRPVRAINLWRPFLQQMVIKERKWRCEEVTLVINMAAHGSSHATDQAGSQYRGHKKKIINTDTRNPIFFLWHKNLRRATLPINLRDFMCVRFATVELRQNKAKRRWRGQS